MISVMLDEFLSRMHILGRKGLGIKYKDGFRIVG